MHNDDMGLNTVRKGKVKDMNYQIDNIDGKFTVYINDLSLSDEKDRTRLKYSAVASFDNLDQADVYIKSLEK